MSSTILKINDDAEIVELATYSLDPERALIAYYMQEVKRNFNTWQYPDHLDVIEKRPLNLGYACRIGNEVIYSRSTDPVEPMEAEKEALLV